jgi:ribosomal protein S18 acetylase RimI-like enzyme
VAEPEGARPAFTIRRAGPKDIPGALELYGQLDRLQGGWRVFEPLADPVGEVEARYRRALMEPDSIHVVAEREGRVVGMALARITVPSSMSDERAAELSNVVVDPPARGRGIGRALVAEVARWARDLGVRRIVIKTYAQNQEALAFWEALGFRPRFVQMTATADHLAALERS